MDNTSTTQKRSPKGGTVGMNGERYEGGCFLPTTKLTKLAKTGYGGATRQSEIIDSIHGLIAVSFDKSFCKITASDDSIAYYGYTRNHVQAIVDRYNNGER